MRVPRAKTPTLAPLVLDLPRIVAKEDAPMNYFLAKTDPETYSIDDLEREKHTVWDGVTNPQAVRAIREMRPGDRVFIYHSGGVSGVVGLARVRSRAARRSEESEIGGGRSGIRWAAGTAGDAGGDQAVARNSTIGRWCGRAGSRPWRRRRSSWHGCASVIRRPRSNGMVAWVTRW